MPNNFEDANGYVWDFEKSSTELLFGLVKHLTPNLADYDEPSFGDVTRLSREQDAVMAKLTVRKPMVGTIKINYRRHDLQDIATKGARVKVTNEDNVHELMTKLREQLKVHLEARDLLNTPLPPLKRGQVVEFRIRLDENSLLYYGDYPIILER